jgi:hypothetical protein
VPRLTLAKQQARIRQLDAALKKMGALHAKVHTRFVENEKVLLAALKDAVKIIDEERNGAKAGWSRDDAKRLERIRLLSLGI